MADESKTSLSQQPKAVDVSTPETQNVIQCTQIRLLHSVLHPLSEEEIKTRGESGFVFKIQAYIEDQRALSHLETEVAFIDPGQECSGIFLRFGMVAEFTGAEAVSSENLADFARFYTLPIVWPYAREYASDQLRRAGAAFVSLPIINPQVVTETLIENDLVEVTMGGQDEK